MGCIQVESFASLLPGRKPISFPSGTMGRINNDNELVGIITDGDLRRWMSPNLITEKVSNVMTKNPKVIGPDALIVDAVNIMNNTGRGITNLFVIDGKKPIGVIHIHDKVLCGGVMSIGDIKGRKELDEAYELGRKIG